MNTTTLSLFAVVATLAACRDPRPSPQALSPAPTSTALADAIVRDTARAAEVHNQATLLDDLRVHHAQGAALARLAERQAVRSELRQYASTLRSTEEHAIDTVAVHADRSGVSSGDGSSGNLYSDAAGDRAGDAAADVDRVSGLGTVSGSGRDLSALVELSGDEFDRVFVDAMIEHLEAGIAIAGDASSGPVSGGALEALIQQERAQVSQLEQWRTAWFQSGSNGD